MSKIVLEDFNEGNGYYKVNLAYLSKEQVEEIEALVSKWNPTDEDIKSCIGVCLTDANEQRFKDYGTSLKDCLAWLEKQVSPKIVADAYLRGCNDTEKKWLEKQGEQKPFDYENVNIQQKDFAPKDEPKFADTLEVKGVDLEKEIQSWVEDNSVNGYYQEDVYETAKHFFELGLKAQKGE